MAVTQPARSPFDIEVSPDEKTFRVKVNGSKLDITTAPDLKTLVEKTWKPTIVNVTIDLTNVEFIDSFGLGTLVGIYKRLPPNAPPAVLYNASPAVVMIIEVVRLDRVFKLQRK